jgi:hypothetical protein
MGALPNCYFPLTNVQASWPASYDGIRIGNVISDIHRIGDDEEESNKYYDYLMDNYMDPSFSYNPGIGSSTIYYSTAGGIAQRDVQMGEELFINYGENYFSTRDHKFGLVPLEQDYLRADAMLHRFRNVANRISNRLGDHCVREEAVEYLDNPTLNIFQSNREQDFIYSRNEEAMSPSIDESGSSGKFSFELYELTKSIITIWPTRVQGALPAEVNGINHMLDVAKSTAWNFLSRSIRDLDYLQNHGSCADYVKSGKSTIVHAGNGAFANTFLPAGTVVSTLPLVHVLDRSVLDIYDNKDDNENDERHILWQDISEPEVIHSQLLLNYCFGHNESTLLLCPYGYGNGLVNHAGPGYQANVNLVWSTKFSRRLEWLNQTLDDWENSEYSGLAFEFVAIRDIEENEEILFDYGVNWEQAFSQHEKENYKSSAHFMYHLLNTFLDNPVELPLDQEKWTQQDLIDIFASRSSASSVEQNLTFTASAIHVWCRATYLRMQNGHNFDELFSDDLSYYPCRIIAKVQSIVSYETEVSHIPHHTEILYAAQIYERNHDDGEDEDEDWICSETPINVAFRLPRDAFVVGNADTYDEAQPNPAVPLESYLTETWTFRHSMGIPNEIMPEKWKNLEE